MNIIFNQQNINDYCEYTFQLLDPDDNNILCKITADIKPPHKPNVIVTFEKSVVLGLKNLSEIVEALAAIHKALEGDENPLKNILLDNVCLIDLANKS